jgi:ABC-type polysaccharide/polyol phosphate transport system ATPase subunit
MSEARTSSTARPVAIEARGVAKSFTIPHEQQTTLKERALRPRTWLRGKGRRLEALRDISFDVARGEFFGVIGRNGSGKSTLLKLLASIYKVDSGTVRIAGRMAPFIELGVGFNPELTARDNVMLNGVMMGLSPSSARASYDAVINYAELAEYTDLKLKNYSSGMQVRLAFSLMLQADADILLVDEVLAVGDLAFQKKCIASLESLKESGTTIVLVTHDMDAVQRHCDRALLIEGGVVDVIGDPAGVAARYIDLLFPWEGGEGDPRAAGEIAAFSRAWISGANGDTVESVADGDLVVVNLALRAREDVAQAQVQLELINNPEGVTLATFRAGDDQDIPLSAGEEIVIAFELDRGAVRPGTYRFNYMLGTPTRAHLLDHSRAALPLRVVGEDTSVGAVHLGHRVSVNRNVAERSR